MRAMQITELGKPLEMRNVVMPKPSGDEVLVRTQTCGLNFGDLLVVKGTYQEKPTLPATIGMELCGVVEDVGPNVKGLSVGQRVAAYSGFGGLAEYITLAICWL